MLLGPIRLGSFARGSGLTLVAAAVLALTAGAVGAAGSTGNLAQDPGGEAAAGAPDSNGVVPPLGWAVTGDFTAVQYGAAGGFPTAANSASINGGANFFGGGNVATSTGTQTVNVSAWSATIDAGTEGASLSGDLGGYSTQDDNMVVTATYLGASGASLGSLTIGPVTEGQRGGQTTLLPQSATGAVPAGTRSIRVVMTSTRLEGTYNDGYGDNISLTLASTPPVFGSSGIVQAPSGKACVSRRAFTIHIRRIGSLTYRQVTVYVAGRSVDVLRGSRISAPVNLRGLPKGHYTVKITVITTTGQQISGARAYHTCAAKPLPGGTHRL
jgi:hypothetical protein